MNAIEQQYFDDLRKHHLGLAASLNDPSMRGVREVISNLYRDDAHFVYELLQNADDQGATYAKFILKEDELIFLHNAPKHFTISDRKTHEKDKEAGVLGDVNSIISIASSSKSNRQDEVPIGKFGLGFKSVFLFTDKPEIYDENIRFSISDYVVPNLIEADHPLRKSGETLFRFRFKPGDEKEAYRKINEKLHGLVNPLLFLNTLRKIEWETTEDSGYYRLEEQGLFGWGHRLMYEVVSDDTEETLELWKFERPIDETRRLSVSAVYCVKDGELMMDRHPLYCYLPTANNSDLPVILHAPFKLTGNRESIMADDEHNKDMIRRLSRLLVDSLKEICYLGEQSQTPWIKDNILDFLPKQNEQRHEITAVPLDISSLTTGVLDAIRENAMLWCQQLSKYLPLKQAFVPDNTYLSDIYDSHMLGSLFKGEFGWVLPSLTYGIRRDSGIIQMIGIERLNPEKILRRLTPAILEQQSTDWLKEWYKSLLKVSNLWKDVPDAFLRYQKIIKTSEDGHFEAPYIRGEKTSNVHLPKLPGGGGTIDNLLMVDAELIEDEDVRNFFVRLGLREVDSFTMAEKVYLPKVKDRELPFEERLKTFVWLVGLCQNHLSSSQQDYLRERCLLPGYSAEGWDFYSPDTVKIHNSDNDFFFQGNKDVVFFEKDKLPDLESADIEMIDRFIKGYPKVHIPTVRESKKSIDYANERRIPRHAQRPAIYRRGDITYEWISEPEILQWSHFLHKVAPTAPKRASELIERLLLEKYGTAVYNSKYYNTTTPYPIDPLYKSDIRNATWVELATPGLRKWLGLPIKELQDEEMESIKTVLSTSGIVSKEAVDSLIEYIKQRDILKDFQLQQSIEEQKAVVSASQKGSLQWLREILELRMKYVEAGEKDDVEFLIKRLQDALSSLDIESSTDLREALPDGINIIFGPPGTGKTTEITRLISNMLQDNPENLILVLTPTNAAAKVVAERLNKIGVEAYRGVNPANLELCAELDEIGIPRFVAEQEDVPSVLVTTVHYYTQTYVSREGCYLHDLDWDAVFIDEMSMVTLDYVLFALFKGKQLNPACQYYLVGDPLQLPPITNLDPFILEEAELDEFNFYSFIGLWSFTETVSGWSKHLRDKIKIRLLTTQYRSERPLCEIMSKFAYDGKVISDFKGETLNLPDSVPSVFKKPLSIVRFPVTAGGTTPEDAAITDLDKLKGSNFNFYSALLLKETLQALFSRLKEADYTRPLSIGIITPYTAQKKVIEKLLNTNSISRGKDVDLYVNTVHQFQGDEFDIVILILNPPNLKMTPKEKILINKKYLINVATSRAKNNLIIMYPDQTCNESNFLYVNEKGSRDSIESLARRVLQCSVRQLTTHAKELEEELFGDSERLSKISEVILHEEVNLHDSRSQKKYRFVKGGSTIDILYSSDTEHHEI